MQEMGWVVVVPTKLGSGQGLRTACVGVALDRVA